MAIISGCQKREPGKETVPGRYEVAGPVETGGVSDDTSRDSRKEATDEATEEATDEATDEVTLAADKTSESINIAETVSPDRVSIIMVGDILLHTPVEEAAKNAETGEYNYDFIFENTKDLIGNADLAIVNEEVIIGGEELGVSGYPVFNAPYEAGDALVKAGFDVVCHATNHALDKGGKGIENCLDFWENEHPDIKVTGIHTSKEKQDEICISEVNNIKIAVLNYTYGTNGIPLPVGKPYAVDLLEKERVKRDLKKAEDEADFTIVVPHWGIEYRLQPSKDQEEWTSYFREYGADLVIGAHPHVIEPYVLYEDDTEGLSNNKNGGDMLVYYSLGNFVNWTSGTGKGVADRMLGGMANVDIIRNEDGSVSIDNYGVTDLVCHLEKGDGNVTVYPLSKYTEELASKNEIIKQDPAFSLDYINELSNTVYGFDRPGNTIPKGNSL